MLPLGQKLAGELMLGKLMAGPWIDSVGGMAVGAVPLVSAILSAAAHHDPGTKLLGFFVRKEAKAHGKGRQIEGGFAKGQRVALVEDTCTTGGSTLEAVDAVVKAGGRVARVLCLVDRGEGAMRRVRRARPHSRAALHAEGSAGLEARRRKLLSQRMEAVSIQLPGHGSVSVRHRFPLAHLLLGTRRMRRVPTGYRFGRELWTVLLLTVWGSSAGALPFGSGNLLVQAQEPEAGAYQIFEFTVGGVLVQTLATEQPAAQTDLFHPRDLVVGADGLLHLYNGTFDPYLSRYDPADDAWSHVTHPGWSTVNNASYGGIARSENSVFVTDMVTFSEPADALKGVVAFDISLGTSTRFATTLEPTDLTLGLDGKLWVLSGAAFAYDPASLTPLGSVLLSGAASDIRSIAVGSTGDFFVATWDGVLFHLDPTGAFLASLTFETSLIDVDVAPSGLVAVAGRFGDVWLTDTAFTFTNEIGATVGSPFVAFAPVPEVGAGVLLATALAFLAFRVR